MIEEQDLVYAFDEDLPLPKDWKITTLEGLIADTGLFCDGDWVESKDQDPDGDVRLIQLADIGVASYRDRSDRYLTSERATALSCTFLKRGDILIARMPDPLGRACIFPGDTKRAVTVVDVAVVRPSNPAVDTRWLMHRINSMAFRNAVASLQSGSTRLRISRRNLSKIAFPLPPLAVQLATVDELEKQFSRLDEAVASLQRVKANLKRYKASVLKAAVEGRLVETEASLAHREGRTFEAGEQLLQRMLAERRAQWAGKGKYKEPVSLEMTPNAEAPSGWVWCNFEQASTSERHALKAGPFGSALKKEFYTPAGYKIYGQEQVIAGDHKFGDYYIAEEKYRELENCAVKPGDILVSLVGTTGKVLVLPEGAEPGIINPRLIKLSLNPEFAAAQYASYYLQSAPARSFFKLQAHGGTMEVLNLGIVKALPICLPPLAEQTRIVAEVDRHLSIIREVEAEVDTNLKRAQALRQATLSKCFSQK